MLSKSGDSNTYVYLCIVKQQLYFVISQPRVRFLYQHDTITGGSVPIEQLYYK